MKGADRFYNAFGGKSQQIGKLYLRMSTHARGKTFRIDVLPPGVTVGDCCSRDSDAVEVYGMVSGQRGWTEVYDWIQRGPWIEDFMVEVGKREAKKAEIELSRSQAKDKNSKEEALRKKILLRSY